VRLFFVYGEVPLIKLTIKLEVFRAQGSANVLVIFERRSEVKTVPAAPVLGIRAS
jgi:hypothetical protein